MSYSTRLALTYPLGSLVVLDWSYDGEGRYVQNGFEGPWYVAGWSGRFDLNLSRDRRRAYLGDWEICCHIQGVIDSDLYKTPYPMNLLPGFDYAAREQRREQLLGAIPTALLALRGTTEQDPLLEWLKRLDVDPDTGEPGPVMRTTGTPRKPAVVVTETPESIVVSFDQGVGGPVPVSRIDRLKQASQSRRREISK